MLSPADLVTQQLGPDHPSQPPWPLLPPPPRPLLQVYQTVTQQLGPDDPGYIDAVVALAELHRELGQTAEAEG